MRCLINDDSFPAIGLYKIPMGQLGNKGMVSSLGQKKKYVCFLLHLKKNRVGRSLLIFYFFLFLFFIFPDFSKKHNKCVVCMKHITKRGLFWAIYLQYRMDVLL